eukprot:g70738.t1
MGSVKIMSQETCSGVGSVKIMSQETCSKDQIAQTRCSNVPPEPLVRTVTCRPLLPTIVYLSCLRVMVLTGSDSTADAGADDDVEELPAGNKLDELVDVDAEERPVGNEPDEPVDVGAGADVVPISIPESAAADGGPANPAAEAAAG